MTRFLLFLSLLVGSIALANDGVSIWTHFTEVQELEWLKAQAQAYEAETGIRVNVVEVPFDDIRQKLTLGAPEGDAADLIVTIPHDWVGELAASGVLEPLDRYADASYLDDLQPVAIDALSYEGRLFGIPMFMEGIALLYNRDLIERAPETWDEFLLVANEQSSNGGFGFLYQLDIPYYGYGWWNAFGGYIFGASPDGGLSASDIGLGGEAGYAAAQFIKDLRFTYGFVPEGIDYQVANSAFIDGAAAMILNGPWAVGDYRAAGLNFGIAPMPSPPGASAPWGPMVGVQGIVLNAYSTSKEAAVDFAEFLVAPEQQVAFNQAGGRIPVALAATAALADDPVVQGFSASIALGDPMPNIPEMGQVWGAWGNALQLVLQSPTSDVEAIIDDMMVQLESN
jgi:arabinogalactan oligomer / maltooligosaccharide transport system substrate-binding protein